jgi:hypothetical protein
MVSDLFLKKEGDKVIIEGLSVEEGKKINSWKASFLGSDHLLLAKEGLSNGFNYVSSTKSLLYMLLGLYEDRWSGRVKVLSPDYAARNLYFVDGEIVFAESDLVDERLGEIIYRKGRLSLEEFSKAAVSVSANLKFGQVLLKEGYVNSYDLWCCLCEQLEYLVESVFISSVNYVMLDPEVGVSNSLFSERSTKNLLLHSYAESLAFRDFADNVTDETLISLESSKFQKKKKSSDYFKEFTKVGDNASVKDLLGSIKSHRITALRALWKFSQLGLYSCEIKVQNKISPLDDLLKRYQNAVDAMHLQVKSNQKIDMEDLERKISLLNTTSPYLYIDSRGSLTKACLSAIVVQSQLKECADKFEAKLKSLCSFVEFITLST